MHRDWTGGTSPLCTPPISTAYLGKREEAQALGSVEDERFNSA